MVYETSTIGVFLTEALGELLAEELITTDLAFKVIEQLDKSLLVAFEQGQISKQYVMTGRLETYRGCEGVWTFFIQNAVFKEVHVNDKTQEIHAERVKMVICDEKGSLPSQS